jgi:hypothetical protein
MRELRRQKDRLARQKQQDRSRRPRPGSASNAAPTHTFFEVGLAGWLGQHRSPLAAEIYQIIEL